MPLDPPFDDSRRLIDEVSHAVASHTALTIRGGNSKAFLGHTAPADAVELDTRSHRGIVHYEPTELVVTARAGTALSDLTAALDGAGQLLPCEPPEFGGIATLGGAVASGLSGPRRPWSGAVRDFVLGCRLITAEAKHLRFGGQVMKNVAGFDMSRLAAGSFGCLAVLTEVSLKVLPKPRASRCVALEMAGSDALAELARWRRGALPVTGACYADGRLHVRFEGGEGSVRSALERVGGEPLDARFWIDLRELRLPFFSDPRPLWRLSLPNATPLMALPGDALLDWGGAQRWLKSDAPAATVRRIAAAAGGHATCYARAASSKQGHPGASPFMPLSPALARLHHQLKSQLDPLGIFNRGRLYGDW